MNPFHIPPDVEGGKMDSNAKKEEKKGRKEKENKKKFGPEFFLFVFFYGYWFSLSKL